jgi:iron-sulfur cluster assembly accessory protein
MSRIGWLFSVVMSLIGCAPQDASENIKQELPLASSERKGVVTLTPPALEMVKSILKQHPHRYLRVKVREGGPKGYLYELGFDDEMDPTQDYVDDFHGVTIIVDRSSEPFLTGTSIDFEDSDGERGFRFHNPNAAEE